MLLKRTWRLGWAYIEANFMVVRWFRVQGAASVVLGVTDRVLGFG